MFPSEKDTWTSSELGLVRRTTTVLHSNPFQTSHSPPSPMVEMIRWPYRNASRIALKKQSILPYFLLLNHCLGALNGTMPLVEIS